MNPAMMNPDMMKAAQKMMANMSPEDMNRMMEMSKNMDPNMVKQAQQMMSNPAMAKQAAAAMENMSGDEMRSKLDAVSSGSVPGLPQPKGPTPTQTVVEKLRASPMSVPEEVIEAVEEAEGYKTIGNKKFKEGDYTAAAGRYEQGAARLAGVSGLGGADKKAVAELKEACHLNLANCKLKLGAYDEAVTECATVLRNGDNRKAYFRRGVALQKLGKLAEARSDLKKAAEMQSDSTVLASLAEVEKALGVEPTKFKSPPTPAPITPAFPGAPPTDPAQMQFMLDQLTPEQMRQQAEMLENMDPSALSSMAPQLGNVSAEQLKMISGMMKNMDPEQMKAMAKMAQSMQGMGMPGMPKSASAASPGSGSEAAMQDMSEMSLEKGMEMLENMNPDMMKAGMEMMKNMDPQAMASMSKAMGREMSEDQLKQMQSMMDKMSPEDLQKWSNRATKAAGWLKKPIKAYQSCKSYGSRLGASGLLAIVAGILAVMAVGHFTDTF